MANLITSGSSTSSLARIDGKNETSLTHATCRTEKAVRSAEHAETRLWPLPKKTIQFVEL